MDGEGASVKSTNSLAFITLKGGDVLTSLPYLHLYVAENAVKKHARIVWAVTYSSGVGLLAWDDVMETFWQFSDMEIMSLTDEAAQTHVACKWKPLHN